MTIKEFIDLYRQCEKEHARWSDNPLNLDYFVNWLEERNQEKPNE